MHVPQYNSIPTRTTWSWPDSTGWKAQSQEECPHFRCHFKVLSLQSTHTSIYLATDLGVSIAPFALLTKVCIVEAMVFPVVMYGCESWTIKKARELTLLYCGAGKTLESPLHRKEIKPVNPKGNQP